MLPKLKRQRERGEKHCSFPLHTKARKSLRTENGNFTVSRWAIDTNEMFMHFQPSVCLSALSMDLSTFRKLVCNVDARQPILYHHLNAIMLKWKHHLYYGAIVVVVVDDVATRNAVWFSASISFWFSFYAQWQHPFHFMRCNIQNYKLSSQPNCCKTTKIVPKHRVFDS